jgi:hypothetical protein
VDSNKKSWLTLLFHILPGHLIEKWRENGLLAICFLGVSLLLAISVNLYLHIKSKKELVTQSLIYDEKIDALQRENTEYEEIIRNDERIKKYASTFEYLNFAFSDLHNTERIYSIADEKEQKQSFKNFCTKISQVFEMITGSKCHVCIKIFVQRNRKNPEKIANYQLGTFVRDLLHSHRESVDNEKKIQHVLKNNTDFEYVFQNIGSEKGKYFFCNDLTSIEGYKNTSFLKHGDSITYFPQNTSPQEKETHWPLDYSSVICAAICPGISDQRNTNTLLGFLCVDSIEKNVFIEPMDTEILCGCADGLYNPLKIFLETFSNKN